MVFKEGRRGLWMNRRPLTVVFVLVYAWLSIAAVFADSLTDEQEIDRRIDFIQDRLDQGTTAAAYWQYSWTAVHGVSSGLQFGFAAGMRNKDQEEDRHDYIVGGITSALAVGDMIVNPLTAWNAADKLRACPAGTMDTKKAKLQYAEQLLRECAGREEYGRSWKPHAAAALVNLLAGIAIAADGGRGGDGALSFATGMLVSEIQIFTMPTRAMGDWKEYSAMAAKGSSISSKNSFFHDRFFVAIHPRAVYCTMRF